MGFSSACLNGFCGIVKVNKWKVLGKGIQPESDFSFESNPILFKTRYTVTGKPLYGILPLKLQQWVSSHKNKTGSTSNCAHCVENCAFVWANLVFSGLSAPINPFQ